ncbi:MAG: hypothetical protein K8S23_12190 [Candidatus Cloacimonetes bacterium]|nr:hypothetical protein [Candidatus Cloacimonadota bacterium]
MIAVYCDKKLDKLKDEIKFSFDFIFKTLGYEYKFINTIEQLTDNDILIYYGFNKPEMKDAYVLAFNKIMFYLPVETGLLTKGFYKQSEIIKRKRKLKFNTTITVLSENTFKQPIGYFFDDELVYGVFNFDLVGNIFFHLVNYEESVFHERDKHNRIPDESSLFIDQYDYPYVNELLQFFDKFIENAVQDKHGYFIIKKSFWPQDEVFAASISHTVDRLQKWTAGKIFKSFFEDILLFYNINYIFKSMVNKLKYIFTNDEEYWNFDIISELEAKFNVHSTYFFGVSQKHEHDVDYEIEEDIINEIVKLLKAKNEISLLASYESFQDDVLGKEKEILNKIIKSDKIGVRQSHFRYNPKKSFEFHRKNQFIYDSSYKILERNGFKNGIAFPYYIFSKQVNKSKETVYNNNSNLEIALTFSDEVLKISRFKEIPFEKAKESIVHLLASVKKLNGLITLDFSLANFADIKYNKDIFRFVLKILKQNKVYKATMQEIADWWKKREAVVVRESENIIFVYFPTALNFFSLKLIGNAEVVSILGMKAEIQGKIIYFSDIKPDSAVKIVISNVSK